MGETIPQLDILGYKVKPQVPEMGYIFLSLPKRGLIDPQTPQATVSSDGHPPHPDGKTLLLKVQLNYKVEHG